MKDEIKLGADAVIYTSTKEEEFKHVDFAMGFDASVMPIELHPKMIGRAWICKACNLDNMGVICSECKKMYNPADPDCELKE